MELINVDIYDPIRIEILKEIDELQQQIDRLKSTVAVLVKKINSLEQNLK